MTAAPTSNALAPRPRSCWRLSATLRPRRLDTPDQLVELRRSIADIVGQPADDFERLLGLSDLQEFADEILVVLQGVQQAGELRTGIVQFLGRAFSFGLELAPLVNQVLPLFRLEAVILRQRF